MIGIAVIETAVAKKSRNASSGGRNRRDREEVPRERVARRERNGDSRDGDGRRGAGRLAQPLERKLEADQEHQQDEADLRDRREHGGRLRRQQRPDRAG